MPPLLNQVFQTLLLDQIDLFISDFNMTGLDETPSKVPLPLTLYRTSSSTTYTKNGPVDHEEGLDLVYVDAARIAPGVAVSDTQIGRAVVSVLPKPSTISFEDAFNLTDHLPVLVTLKHL